MNSVATPTACSHQLWQLCWCGRVNVVEQWHCCRFFKIWFKIFVVSLLCFCSHLPWVPSWGLIYLQPVSPVLPTQWEPVRSRPGGIILPGGEVFFHFPQGGFFLTAAWVFALILIILIRCFYASPFSASLLLRCSGFFWVSLLMCFCMFKKEQ